MPVARARSVPTSKLVFALWLLGCAAAASAECALNLPAPGVRTPCLHELTPPSPRANRPTSEARWSNDARRDDSRWDNARVLSAASIAGQGATEHESAVARSMSELSWKDSSDWIRNPPQWVQDIKDSRRRRAPVPVVHLWQSQQTQTLIALGVSHRGQPGVFISRKLPY